MFALFFASFGLENDGQIYEWICLDIRYNGFIYCKNICSIALKKFFCKNIKEKKIYKKLMYIII